MADLIDQCPIEITGLTLTRLGFGGAPLGNLYRSLSDDDSMLTVTAAREAGISYFDTAPYYGFGLSERRLGDAIRGRDGIVVSTKVGRLLKPPPGADRGAERDRFCSPLPFDAVFDYGALSKHFCLRVSAIPSRSSLAVSTIPEFSPQARKAAPDPFIITHQLRPTLSGASSNWSCFAPRTACHYRQPRCSFPSRTPP